MPYDMGGQKQFQQTSEPKAQGFKFGPGSSSGASGIDDILSKIDNAVSDSVEAERAEERRREAEEVARRRQRERDRYGEEDRCRC